MITQGGIAVKLTGNSEALYLNRCNTRSGNPLWCIRIFASCLAAFWAERDLKFFFPRGGCLPSVDRARIKLYAMAASQLCGLSVPKDQQQGRRCYPRRLLTQLSRRKYSSCYTAGRQERDLAWGSGVVVWFSDYAYQSLL